MMRLNKYVAHYSTYSRREADKTIQLGFVKVNNEVQTNPATQIDEERDEVRLKGNLLTPKAMYTIIVYNKNKGELVTKKDPRERKTIYDTLDHKFRHFMPVGRLDYASEGLLLLTDSSKVATALMTSDTERIYKVKIKGPVTQAMQDAMKEGIHIDDATAGGHKESKIESMTFAPFTYVKIQKDQHDYSILKVGIHEGQNRELRRFFAYFGSEVVDLKRLSFGSIELNALPNGKTRYLSRQEYSDIKGYIKELNQKEKERK
ncbi:MAG: rRNA pseudouridine synthase [Thiovulaceae bacterium]|nr:rRNA pseudouridine synthase [Sulfurimonadaceae bacterium]